MLVGLSGGADSVCLLHFLHFLAAKKHFHLEAVHVNHGLRGSSARKDAAFAKTFCQKLGVEYRVEKIDTRKIMKEQKLRSVEQAARKGRYAVFERAAKQTGAAKLALGHHLDDQVETILLNVLRGTKAKGLLGIPVRRSLNAQTEIVRPLLCVTRAEVEAYLAKHDLTYVTDETNADDAFTRNWVRNELLPLLEKKQPQIREHLALIAQDLRHYMQD